MYFDHSMWISDFDEQSTYNCMWNVTLEICIVWNTLKGVILGWKTTFDLKMQFETFLKRLFSSTNQRLQLIVWQKGVNSLNPFVSFPRSCGVKVLHYFAIRKKHFLQSEKFCNVFFLIVWVYLWLRECYLCCHLIFIMIVQKCCKSNRISKKV